MVDFGAHVSHAPLHCSSQRCPPDVQLTAADLPMVQLALSVAAPHDVHCAGPSATAKGVPRKSITAVGGPYMVPQLSDVAKAAGLHLSFPLVLISVHSPW